MKTMNKMIAATMMAMTMVMPAMAGNKHHNERKTTVVVVNNDRKAPHYDRVATVAVRHDVSGRHAYRPDVKACTFKVSHHTPHHRVAERAERIHGVMDTKWNPRTREMTVIYDANVTTARHIRHSVA